MIEVKNLVKTYKDKKTNCEALKGVSFKLPDKGLIFIVGKSGSGKSTLLNLLGGIDFPTDGEIVYNGKNINSSDKELDCYRSACIGFVFQDFCLIESMSVYDNIELALSIKGEENKDLIFQTIKDMDLEGKENVPVNLLSGGQKQRVAIARSLIKNSSIILADEPTGNLDSKTSKQIFEILKKLSNDKLVIVISHNLNEAYKYSDRIIELSEGKIVKDLDRIPSEKNIDVAVLSSESNIDENELAKINDCTRKYNVVIRKNEADFVDHKDCDIEINHVGYLNDKKKFRKKWKLFKYFSRSKWIGMIVTSIVISLLIVLIGLCQSYNSVNEKQLLKEAIVKDDSPLIFRKGYYDEYKNEIDTKFLGSVTEDDIDAFIENGYEGNIYKLYRYPIPLIFTNENISKGISTSFNLGHGIYITTSGLGVLQCDEKYLKSLYGVDGELIVLSGKLDLNPYGIIVTDYYADALLNTNPNLISNSGDIYSNLINTKEPLNRRYNINAVVYTGYKERYKWIFDKIEEARVFPTEIRKIMEEVKNSEITLNFINEVDNYLSIAYTFNDNFVEETIENPRKASHINYFENVEFKDEEGNVLEYGEQHFVIVDGTDVSNGYVGVNDGEVYVTIDFYNKLYETNITSENKSEFLERELIIDVHTSSRSLDDEPKFSKSLIVKGVFDFYDPAAMIVSDNDFKEFRRADMSVYALYFDEGKNEESVYLTAESLFFVGSSKYIRAVQEVCDVTLIFKSIFSILFIGLVVATVLLLSSYSKRTVNSYKRELGVIRSMGGKSIDFAVPFVMIVILVGIISAVISSIGIYAVCGFVNDLVVNAFVEKTGMAELSTLQLFSISPLILISDLIILFVIILISSITPILLMKKIRLVNILRRE